MTPTAWAEACYALMVEQNRVLAEIDQVERCQPRTAYWWPGYLPTPAEERPTLPAPAPAPARPPLSKDCPCGIDRRDCEYHRCP